ncbi:hypothetical protein [uncultured Microbacterium sp.]|uniref:hypothetical protein n=1 Tax=uncultured Microbacterium sp. TaxID=191216 RepID=UPI00262A501F|nr:hypothetical protein [uncultured Microbacterium sp.]
MSGIGDQGMRPPGVEHPPVADPEPGIDDAEAHEDVGEVPAGRAGADSGAADAVRISSHDEAGIPDASPQNDAPGVGPGRPKRA